MVSFLDAWYPVPEEAGGARTISGRFDKLDAAVVSTLEKVLTS
ncbi:hypothetical protein [Rhodococcus koreensis]